MPTVSVVMSCYNSEKYLRKSIESILSQSFKDFEFIIWNDGSTDRTEEIIKSYTDKRIKYFYAPNQGLGKALHDACLKAIGKYIARMDDDDIALPMRLEEEVKFMSNHPKCILASCAVQYIGEDGECLGFSAPALSNYVLKHTFSFVHPGAIFRREVYLKTIGYLNLKTAQDKVLWQILAPFGEFRNINKILLKYRLRKDSIVRKQRIKELTHCCEILRSRIVKECRCGKDASIFLRLHNDIYNINRETSMECRSIEQRNVLLTKVSYLLSSALSDNLACKILSLAITLYKTIIISLHRSK